MSGFVFGRIDGQIILAGSVLAEIIWDEPDFSGNAFQCSIAGLWEGPNIGLATVALAFLVILALDLFLTKTYFGKAIRAVSQDHEAAGLMGINTTKTYLISFAIGIALAGVPGILVALQGFNPELSFELTNKALIVVILAGVGSINGLLIGGLLLGAAEAGSVFFMGAAYRDAIGLLLFVLFLLFRPQGLLGKKT